MSERQHHINCKEGDVGRYVLFTRDPGLVPLISVFDEAWEVTRKREYLVHTGYIDGIKVSAVSTGIGGRQQLLLWKNWRISALIP